MVCRQRVSRFNGKVASRNPLISQFTAAFSSPRSQFFPLRTDPKPANNIYTLKNKRGTVSIHLYISDVGHPYGMICPVMVNWQLSRQVNRWPVSRDHIADLILELARFVNLLLARLDRRLKLGYHSRGEGRSTCKGKPSAEINQGALLTFLPIFFSSLGSLWYIEYLISTIFFQWGVLLFFLLFFILIKIDFSRRHLKQEISLYTYHTPMRQSCDPTWYEL